ncbi:unnamed protein product [Microthlaspi erraticum]|uniref:Uncharacterized protein n=1 Tax=Microthlaspi erraticum TaxID=1685480 RepID=A0A6D2I8W0_9BRAS|nr:unnamed protein product [Microthlaspi erraticum]
MGIGLLNRMSVCKCSRGSSNLLSPHELQRADREKQKRRARNRAERESTSEVELREADSAPDTMADNAGGAPPPGVNPPPEGFRFMLNVRRD